MGSRISPCALHVGLTVLIPEHYPLPALLLTIVMPAVAVCIDLVKTLDELCYTCYSCSHAREEREWL